MEHDGPRTARNGRQRVVSALLLLVLHLSMKFLSVMQWSEMVRKRTYTENMVRDTTFRRPLLASANQRPKPLGDLWGHGWR